MLVRDILRDIGHEPVPVTSGSKGIHLYAPLDGSQTPEQATEVARELALALESDHPDLVISTMKRSQRDGKVFIDWSQNNGAKTTVSPVLIARPGPAVGCRAANLGRSWKIRICGSWSTRRCSRDWPILVTRSPLWRRTPNGIGSPSTAACATRPRHQSQCPPGRRMSS